MQLTQGQPVTVHRRIGLQLTGRVALEHTSAGYVGVRPDSADWQIIRFPQAEVSPTN